MHRTIIALLLLAPAAAWSQVEVISPRADSVSVTIYRDLFALITETRTVDLPAEAVTLSFDGVVETLIPASAVVTQLDRRLEERNYDYEALAPAALLRHSVGKQVILTRTAPGSGRVTRVPATITSATKDGVTLRTANGHEALRCSGLPEGLTFEEIPGDLNPAPRLSLRLAAGPPGRRVIRLSYIAQGFAWSSNYVARLAANGRSMDLTGWVTLRNLTHASLRDAEVQVVAGRLNLIDEDEGGTSMLGDLEEFESEQELQEMRDGQLWQLQEELTEDGEDLAFLHGCYPMGPPPTPSLDFDPGRMRTANADLPDELEEVVVTGLRGSLLGPEMLADYHLYRMPWPTDLNARQTKQAVFLQKAGVKIEHFYSLKFDPEADDELQRPRAMIAFDNRKSAGLGEPLPGGRFRLFDAVGSVPVFAGEATMGDRPVGLPIELSVAGAMDLAVEVRAEKTDDKEVDVVVSTHNAKAWPVLLEFRQAPPDEDLRFEVIRSTHRLRRKSGDFMWQVSVPANSVTDLRYRLRLE